MDIRSENETGKLLFKWDPDTDIISVACKDAVYDVRLIRSLEKKTYRVIGKRSKKNAPRASPEYIQSLLTMIMFVRIRTLI